jgi:hypothetical protein
MTKPEERGAAWTQERGTSDEGPPPQAARRARRHLEAPRRQTENRAARLLRWYPKAWRSRYGEEFTELLIADLDERPRSRSRTADVIRGGIVARLADAGLCGYAPEAAAQVRASLASLVCCAAVFIGFGGAMWSQLTIGWQWSEPDTAGVTVATFVTSGAMLVFAALALLATLPVAWSVASRVARRQPRGLLGPSLLFLVGLAVVVVGGRHFANGWPGTGGHPWARQGLVPGGVAAFSWASTLSVSSFWAHPAALAAFPPAELAWMALSPLAVACVVAGGPRRSGGPSSRRASCTSRPGSAPRPASPWPSSSAGAAPGSPAGHRDRETCSTPESSTSPGPRS